MNTSMNWIVRFSEHEVLFTMALLLAKVTVLLAVAWSAHILLRKANPRWRVLLWRSTGMGMLLLIALMACPPILSWGVLPSEAQSSRNSQPSTQSAAQAVSGVVHESPAAPALVGDQPPASRTPREDRRARQRSRSHQPLATSKIDRPEPPPVVAEIGAAPASAWNHTKVILSVIGGLWFAGFVGLVARTLFGLRRLRTIVRRSLPVPDWVSEQVERVNSERSFELRKSAEVATPCLVGIWRPVVLLPEKQVDIARREELPAILIHETAHVKARDLPWNGVLHALCMLFWFHPLVWRIRLAHVDACDAVADSVAADHVGDVTHYIRTLARLAVQMHNPAPGAALAMARASSVRQRIEALQRKLFLARLPRGRMMLAVALAAIVVVVLGGSALTRSEAEPQMDVASTDDLEQGVSMTGRVLTADGQPIEGAQVLFGAHGYMMYHGRNTKTDADGRFLLKNCRPGMSAVVVRAEGFCPELRKFGTGSRDVGEFRLSPGHTMRIRVVDSKGQPIRDVRFAAENWCGYRAVALLRRKTDEEGRILWDSAPSDTVRCCFLKSGYMTVRETPLVASDEEHVITLRPALVITGRVTDAKTGQPISTLEIRHGRLRPTSTKPEWAEQAVSFRDGAYRCEFDEPSGGRYALLVAAEGYQPVESRPFQIDEGTVTLDLALRPGQDRSAPSEAIVYSRQTTEGDEDATKRNRLVVHATAKETGKPLGGVKIRFDGGFEREVETNDEGIVSIEWDARAEFGRLFVSCFKSGFVPIHCLWGSGRGESDLPEDVHLRFQAGKWIGGIVQDQDGRPIEGATVKVRKIVDLPKPAYYWHNVAELKTDAEGRWRWKGVPSDLSHFGIDISHPSYVERLHQLTAGTETPYVIKRGRRVTGRVLTSDGTPIEGATALFGYDRSMAGARKVSTNSEGRFEVENCKPGESLATVQAEGYSPTQREIVVGEHEDLGEFRLTKGHTLRVRIVDSRGDPPKSAYLKVESWKGHGALAYFAYADEEGRVLWQSAPEDTVLCTIRGAGCSELTNYPLQASDEEHVVTLAPELIITGNVTDAKTGQPIPSSVICPGFDRSPNGMFWVWNGENHYKGGAYQWNPRGQIAGGPSVAS